MPEIVTCTECGVKLKLAAAPAPGKKMRCPKCNAVFTPVVPAADEEADEAPAPPPRVATRPAPAPVRSAPAAKPAPVARRDEEEDEDDAPPPRKRRDEDDEDDRPKKKRGSASKRAGSFEFDGKAGDFFPTALVAMLLIMFTLGIGTPWAICKMKSWEAEHTTINGRRLRFDGTGGGLFGLILVSYILIGVTFGIYYFWAIPKIQKWLVENTAFEDE